MNWKSRSLKTIRALAPIACLLFSPIHGLTQQQTPSPAPENVIRINTELVQTGVTVLDSRGNFVNGLTREQFELTVDGKLQPISFFEQVEGGSARERLQLESKNQPSDRSPASSGPARTIVFFIDDLHLSLDSLGRTRKMLTQFIDHEMVETDQVAIASASGEIGFLQQFTDNKAVLRAAAGRLTHKPYNIRSMTRERTPMTEYMALTIERKGDPGVFQFYVDECLKEAPPRYPRRSCEVEVINRARLMLLQAASVIVNTYTSLQSLMDSAAKLPGRKLAFFISDGFLLDTGPRNADPRERLHRIIDEALRGGVVIYTIDARGLVSGQMDATNNVPIDIRGRLETTSLAEIPASQDAMNGLARDTGGRALRNQNYFDSWVSKILDETSNYYLLAWRPDKDEGALPNFRNIDVRVIGHPEYTVRLPRGFLTKRATPPKAPVIAEVPLQPHQELQDGLTTLYPRREIPTSLSAIFLDAPEHGMVLTSSVRVANDTLSYRTLNGKQVASVDLVGVVVNDRGKPASTFQTRLNINAPAGDGENLQTFGTIYNYRVPLPPGLYQVRVATRDITSGQVGSARQWIEIPDLKSRLLTLSSLLLGVKDVGAKETIGSNSAPPQVQFSVDHRFARNSRLTFMVFIYNATQVGKLSPDLSIQASLLQRGRTVNTEPPRKVLVGSADLMRIVGAGEMSLNSIPPGEFVLQVTVSDEYKKATAIQRTRVTIE